MHVSDYQVHMYASMWLPSTDVCKYVITKYTCMQVCDYQVHMYASMWLPSTHVCKHVITKYTCMQVCDYQVHMYASMWLPSMQACDYQVCKHVITKCLHVITKYASMWLPSMQVCDCQVCKYVICKGFLRHTFVGKLSLIMFQLLFKTLLQHVVFILHCDCTPFGFSAPVPWNNAFCQGISCFVDRTPSLKESDLILRVIAC
jgi:hypothetical protein